VIRTAQALWKLVQHAAIIVVLAGCGREEETASLDSEHIVLRDRVAGIDPIHVSGLASGMAVVASNIYEPLFQHHYLKRPYEIVPCLAAEMPQWSADGLKCQIRLREDARFDDDACFSKGRGRTVSAEDVIFSWKRIADPRNASAFWAHLEHRIVGLDEYRQALRENLPETEVSGLHAVDEHTLEILLTRPWPQIIHLLAHPATAVVPSEALRCYGADFLRHPVGTGPFRLHAWQPGTGVVLKRSPTFRLESYPAEGAPDDAASGLLADAGRRLPQVDEVHFHVIEASEPAWLLFLQGKIDHLGIPTDHFSDVLDAHWQLRPAWDQKGLRVDVFPSMFLRWIGFNMADPVIANNLPLRRAISLAMNRQEFNDLFLGGRCGLPGSLLPPGMKEHRPELRDTWMTFDLARARAQRLEAEKVHGGPIPPLTLRMGGTSPLVRQIGQLITRWLADVGLELHVDYVDERSLATTLKERPPSMFFGDGYSMTHPDPTDLFRRFANDGRDATENRFHYHNARFDEWYHSLIAMPESPERIKLCHKMEDLLLQDLPCIGFLSYNWVSVRHDWLTSFKPHAFSGPAGLIKYHRIDGERRAQWQQQPPP